VKEEREFEEDCHYQKCEGLQVSCINKNTIPAATKEVSKEDILKALVGTIQFLI
jgi:hypothetical protein